MLLEIDMATCDAGKAACSCGGGVPRMHVRARALFISPTAPLFSRGTLDETNIKVVMCHEQFIGYGSFPIFNPFSFQWMWTPKQRLELSACMRTTRNAWTLSGQNM